MHIDPSRQMMTSLMVSVGHSGDHSNSRSACIKTFINQSIKQASNQSISQSIIHDLSPIYSCSTSLLLLLVDILCRLYVSGRRFRFDTCTTFHVLNLRLRRRATGSWRVCEAPCVDMVDLERAGCSIICVFECICIYPLDLFDNCSLLSAFGVK